MVEISPTMASHKLNIIPHGQTIKTEREAFPPRSPSNHSNGSGQLVESRFHQRSEVPRMASQCGGGSKEMR